MKINRQMGTTVILGAIVTTLVVAVVIAADAPIVGQNNRVTVRYVTTSTTFTDIPGLSFTLLPNTNYLFTISIVHQGNNAIFGVGTLPLGTTFTVCGTQDSPIGSSTYAGCTSTVRHYITYNPSSPSTYSEPAFFTGAVVTGSTGGTFNFDGAVYSAGYSMSVEVNSWIQAQVSSA